MYESNRGIRAYESNREIRAKAIEIAAMLQSNVNTDIFTTADRIFDYISDGKKHPDGLRKKTVSEL